MYVTCRITQSAFPKTDINSMTQIKKEDIQGFQLLANYISRRQDDILKDWETRFEDYEQASKLISLSRKKFHNHVPVFLDIICKHLQSEAESAEYIAKEHGAHRWEHGLDLRETTKEWAELHKVLLTYLEAAQDEISLSEPVLKKAREIIVQLIHEGIQNSVNEFYKLQDREAKAQMRDLEKALSKKQFHDANLQQTSHDLKGMLLSLQIGFSFLKEETYDEKTEEIIKEMSLAADSLEQLLNSLLDLFRLEAGEEKMNITMFNASNLFNDICNSFRPMADSKSLELHCTAVDDFSVQGDRNKIQRIAQNLIINALKYTEEGEIDVRWELISETDWRLTVSDTGPGLEATSADSLTTETDTETEPGRRNYNAHGEGIGLLIVRRLCKLLHAVIKVETTSGEGTTFRIVFPLEYEEG